jgi:multidrug efflux pump
MNFTATFIRRPVFATVLSLIILLVGLKCYFTLPIRLYPKIDAPAVTIKTSYSGADAALMESFVTTPIENAITGIDGIDFIRSESSTGNSSIGVFFKLGYNIDLAVSDVNSKVSAIRSQLPTGIDDPVVAKLDPDAEPVVYFTFDSDSIAQEEIADYLVRTVQPQLQTLPGVSQVSIFGPTYAMRLWLNPELMAAHHVDSSDIATALKSSNLQTPAGTLETKSQLVNVKTEAELATSKEFNDLIIRQNQGNVVRLQDVGRAELSSYNFNVRAFLNGKPAVLLGVTPGPTANPLEVAKITTQALPQITQALPATINSRVVWDTSRFIQSSIREVKKTIFQAMFGVIAIIFLCLFSWRILLIPVVTIPLAIIGACGLMAAMGYSINTITLLAFVLAIGMVVDDAIVVSENIHRHLAAGKSPFEAATIGSNEIQFAVISMTLTLAAVYAPIGFLSGLVGALFKEFAFTLAGAVIISGFVALTLTPMMCSKLMKPNILSSKGAQRAHAAFDKITNAYKKTLTVALHYRKFIIGILISLLATATFIYKMLPEELAPREDIGMVRVISTAPTAASINYTQKYTDEVSKILAAIPEGKISFLEEYTNNASSTLTLKDWGQRKRSAQEIIEEIAPKLKMIPGIIASPGIPSLFPGSGDQMQVKFVVKTRGDYNELNNIMQKLKIETATNPGFGNIDIVPKLDQNQVNITINRDKAADLGIAIKDLGNAINVALGEPKTTQFSIAGHSYDVIPQLAEEFRDKPEALNMIYMRSNNDEMIPLSNLVSLKEIIQPRTLNHFQQMRAATFMASLKNGYTLGDALQYLSTISKKIVPNTMQIDYAGESRRFIQTMGTMGTTFIFALVFIFLILAAQFESFRDPFIVLFSVPLSIFGALLALLLTGGTLNIFSEIGLVTLIGLISKHGILMVEFANQLQKEGLEIKEAIIEAATIRLRPILMTTGAMILGALPLALATGSGAISRREIGVVIIGGMFIGTLFTLFVVPTIYTYLASKKK